MPAPPRRTTALGAVAAFAVLLVAAPSPARAVDVLRDPSAGDLTGPLVAVVALLAWALAAWLLLTAALTLLSRVPGGVGRAARSAVRRTAPAALRQLVGAALGITVLAGAVAAPASATTGAPPAPSTTASPPALSLDWPAPAAPDLDWPAAGPHLPTAAPAPDLDWPDGQGPAPVLGSATSTGAAADAVVVQPGDSLWSVAEDALERERGAAPSEAEVAAAWPSWWSANRDVVGDDPDLLLPGTALRPPPSADAG